MQSAHSRDNYESAPYEVLEKDSQFEIRHYPSLNVITTNHVSDNESFRRLFGYISGNNINSQKIAMTTPAIKMTSASSREQDKYAFVMPSAISSMP